MRYRYWILAMLVSLFASCGDGEILSVGGGDEAVSDLVTEVSASCGSFTAGITRATNDGNCCSACNGDCTCNGECTNLTSDGDKKMVKNTCPEDGDYILGIKNFKEGDRIYILQKGPNLTPYFPGDFFDHRNDTTYKKDNIYVYEYNRNDNATWSDEYNFKYNPKRSDPISWGKVKENGSIGNSFVFYAFCDNLKDLEPDPDDPLLYYWNHTNGQVTASFGPVEYFHHAYGGKWKKSDNVGGNYDYSNDWHVYQYQNHCGVPDFLGAYHTTSTLYSRPRFKFYHLLAYVRVTLYVPIVEEYDDTDSNTGKVTKRTTGFDKTAFVLTNDGSGNGTGGEINDYRAGVSIGNHNSANRVIRTRFTIDWNANRSSDKDAPLTQTLDVANTAGFLYYYCMYLHNPLDITDLRYKPKEAAEDYAAIEKGIGEEELDVTKFVENNANAKKYLTPDENGRYIDKVRRYEFSAAMPAQDIPTSGTVGGKTATSTLVDIHARVPGTGVDEIYNGTNDKSDHNNFVEYTLSTKNFIEGANDLAFKQNTITHLHIYLPRVADEAILVNAEVLPWEETHTDMAVSPDDWGDEDNDISEPKQ